MTSTALRSFDYLEQLSETEFRQLYEQPSTALAIFRRFLTPLAKSFVMAMLFLNNPFPVAHLDTWVRPDSKVEEDNALYVLERLKIISISPTFSGESTCYVTKPFNTSLRHALTGMGKHQSFGVPASIEKSKRIGFDQISLFATTQWESLLYYIVGSSNKINVSQAELGERAKELLRKADFVAGTQRIVEITAKGFDFLLQELNAQVWGLLIEYIDHASARENVSKVEILSFLFTIGSLELGQDYSRKHFDSTQQQILKDLHDFGMVFMPQDSAYFYPTPIAACITSDSSFSGGSMSQGSTPSKSGSSSSPQGGFIVIETNYRIYAYTQSQLQIEILNLFTRLVTRYPNMVAGRITRESIQGAIVKGITSQQIISYLTTHAHTVMNAEARDATSGFSAPQRPQLPPTVIDQIRLWQIEGDRMQTTPGFLFSGFASRREFESTVRYADEIGVLVWRNDNKQLFFVSRIEQVQQYLKNQQERHQREANGT